MCSFDSYLDVKLLVFSSENVNKVDWTIYTLNANSQIDIDFKIVISLMNRCIIMKKRKRQARIV